MTCSDRISKPPSHYSDYIQVKLGLIDMGQNNACHSNVHTQRLEQSTPHLIFGIFFL